MNTFTLSPSTLPREALTGLLVIPYTPQRWDTSRYLLPVPLYSCDLIGIDALDLNPLTPSRPLAPPFTSPGNGCQSAHTCGIACRNVCPGDLPCVVSQAPPRWGTAPRICRGQNPMHRYNRRKSTQRKRAARICTQVQYPVIQYTTPIKGVSHGGREHAARRARRFSIPMHAKAIGYTILRTHDKRTNTQHPTTHEKIINPYLAKTSCALSRYAARLAFLFSRLRVFK
jgi:hypothetical protein